MAAKKKMAKEKTNKAAQKKKRKTAAQKEKKAKDTMAKQKRNKAEKGGKRRKEKLLDSWTKKMKTNNEQSGYFVKVWNKTYPEQRENKWFKWKIENMLEFKSCYAELWRYRKVS